MTKKGTVNKYPVTARLCACSLLFLGTPLLAQEAGDLAEAYAEDTESLKGDELSLERSGHFSVKDAGTGGPVKAPEDFIPPDPSAAPLPAASSDTDPSSEAAPQEEDSQETLSEGGAGEIRSLQDMARGGHYPQALTHAASHSASLKALKQKQEEARRIQEIKKLIQESAMYQAIQTVSPLPASTQPPMVPSDALLQRGGRAFRLQPAVTEATDFLD